MSLTLGGDPEFFIKDKAGRPVPAHRFFGPKEAPTIVKSGGDSRYATPIGKLYRDGYAVEINLDHAPTCREQFTASIITLIHGAQASLPSGYTLSADPVVHIQATDLDDAPEDVKSFGCHPSLNAYTGAEEAPPAEGARMMFRGGGGHIHFGHGFNEFNQRWGSYCSKNHWEQWNRQALANRTYYDKNSPIATNLKDVVMGKDPCPYGCDKSSEASQWFGNVEDQRLFVKMLDRYLGLPFTVIDPAAYNFARRQYYGKAGEYRWQTYVPFEGTAVDSPFKNHGIEYRVLSNFVYRNTALLSLALGAGRKVFTDFSRLKATWNPALEEPIRNAINTGEGVGSLLEYTALDGWQTAEDIAKLSTHDWSDFQMADPRANGRNGWDNFRRGVKGYSQPSY